MNLGIYIHIPFCKSRCFYCDFCSTDKYEASFVEEYINALKKEILQNVEILSESAVDSIYIGGGTPSVIDSKYIIEILNLIYSCTSVAQDAEITIEVNPESVTKEKLEDYVKARINRISIGLQSADNDILKSIGRISTKDMFSTAYGNILKAGFENISVDVMCGLPKDNLNNFKKTIEYVLSLPKLKHISSYSLEVYENSKLDFLIKNNFLTLPSDDEERCMKHMLDDMLKENEFNMYEISNYALKGFEAFHNTKYWNGDYYLGFGASAASYINSCRYTNVRNIQEYIIGVNNNNLKKVDVEELDLLDLEKEYIILGLRKTSGISISLFKQKFKEEIMNVVGIEINKCIKEGLLEKTGDKIYLTAKGQDVANIVWQEFI